MVSAVNTTNALKNVLAALVNGVAGLYFALVAHVAWGPVAIIAGSPREDGAGRARAALEQTLRAQGSLIAVSRTIALSAQERAEGQVGEAARSAVVETLADLTEAAADAPAPNW